MRRKKRALVFDHDRVTLNLFGDFFSSLGYESITLAEPEVCPLYGNDAKACVHRHPCGDVLITDFAMPRMNGLELLAAQSRRGCRLAPGNKALITGNLDREKIRGAHGLGCSLFTRPPDLDDIEAWLGECEKRMDLSQPLGDRRREPRILFAAPAACELHCGDDRFACFIHNASDHGYCINAPAALERGQIVRVTAAPSRAPRAAVIEWVRKQQNGFCLAGLRCC